MNDKARIAGGSTATSKGQATIPKPVRDAMGIKDGTPLTWTYENGELKVRAKTRRLEDFRPMASQWGAGTCRGHEPGHRRSGLRADAAGVGSMIGIDTSVLVRVFAEDDPGQSKATQHFMKQRSSDDPAFVSAVVVAEVSRVLDRSYAFPTASIREALEWLFESTNIVVEKQDLLQTAVAVAAERNADISDCIISALAGNVPGMELLS